MLITVIVNGATGKMGRAACAALAQDERFEVVGQLGRQDDLAAAIAKTKAAVVLDLTRADVVYKNVLTIVNAGARPVVGTSGLTDIQRETLIKHCEVAGLGGLIVPNFSLGVLLMMHFAKKAAQFFPDVEIIEMHHAQKIDAPSATAIKTAHLIAEARKQPLVAAQGNAAYEASRGERFDDIPIHAIRLPGVLAKQSVIFGGLGEQLTVMHESMDRQCFMPGVLLACEKVMSLKTLKYGLEHVIEGLEA
ncbi:MAG: 4-hydroxy-tetrahydrodipicolinate reductase [Gammaproteobacteria bacterium]|nr:4-hydroxy-tetrahydrodipicolinate reductase [Gammaproteobacteria bacterium]